jgi:hypothetical protein
MTGLEVMSQSRCNQEIKMKRIALALLLSTLAAPAYAGGDGDGEGFEIGNSFYAPSHNIYCNYYDAGGEAGTAFHDNSSEIHCAVLKPKQILVVLTGKGSMAITRPIETNMERIYAEKENVLAYGKTIKNGSHICKSTKHGMICTVDGKGFILSRDGVKSLQLVE